MGIPEPEKRFRQYPHQFSGGMRQRVMIAIAFACDPKLLICDEPTTALDVTIQSQILDLIKELQKTHNTSVIMITHDLGVVANMAQEIAVMYSASIVEKGSSRDIFYRPRHPYTWALIDSVPRWTWRTNSSWHPPRHPAGPAESAGGLSLLHPVQVLHEDLQRADAAPDRFW